MYACTNTWLYKSFLITELSVSLTVQRDINMSTCNGHVRMRSHDHSRNARASTVACVCVCFHPLHVCRLMHINMYEMYANM